MSPTPMLFFKYQKPGNLEFTMLRRGEIYFASPSELNDAHECRPHIILNGNAELWLRFAEFVLRKVCFKSGLLRSADDIVKLLNLSGPVSQRLRKGAQGRDLDFGTLGQVFVDVVAPFLEKCLPLPQSHQILRWIMEYINIKLRHALEEERYIASFSLNATNPTMWGHYAGAERGFVIVFVSSDGSIHVRSEINILAGCRPAQQIDDEFNGIDEYGMFKEMCLELKKVKYGVKVPRVNAFNQLIPKFYYTDLEDAHDVPLLLVAPEKQESRLGLVKYSGWRYEEELRAFFPTWRARSHDVRALQVESKNIAGLIFGPKMSLSDKERAVVCCYLMKESLKDEHSGDFAFFQAEQPAEKFDLRIKPIGILERHWVGDGLPLKLIEKLPEAKAQEIAQMAKVICARRSTPNPQLPEIHPCCANSACS